MAGGVHIFFFYRYIVYRMRDRRASRQLGCEAELTSSLCFVEKVEPVMRQHMETEFAQGSCSGVMRLMNTKIAARKQTGIIIINIRLTQR